MKGREKGRERGRLRFQWTEHVDRGNEFFFSRRDPEKYERNIYINITVCSFLRHVLLLGS